MTLTFSAGRQNKIHISVDGEYSMTVDADFWFTLGFSNGDEIDEEQLAELSRAVKERRAYNKALNLLSYRDHSSRSLQTSCGAPTVTLRLVLPLSGWRKSGLSMTRAMPAASQRSLPSARATARAG